MMPSLYDLERLFELEQRSREERMRHEQGCLVRRRRERQSFARLTFGAYLLSLFRLG